jgi:signal transduction histidine kinase
MFLGALLFLFKRDEKNPVYRTQSIYYSIAILMPLVFHILQIVGIIKFDFMISILFLPLSMFILTMLILKYQFLDIIPGAIRYVIDNTMDGMLVVNNNGNIIDYNTLFFEKKFDMYDSKTFQTIYNFVERLKIYSIETQTLTDLYKSVKSNHHQITKGTLEIDEQIVIYYTAKPLLDYKGNKVATLITFFDMSEIYRLYNALEAKNNELNVANIKLKKYLKAVEKLTVEEEINRIMTEIHDTLGHSMTELLALIEVTGLQLEKNDEDAMETIQSAIDKARSSLEEIRLAVAKYKKMGGFV